MNIDNLSTNDAIAILNGKNYITKSTRLALIMKLENDNVINENTSINDLLSAISQAKYVKSIKNKSIQEFPKLSCAKNSHDTLETNTFDTSGGKQMNNIEFVKLFDKTESIIECAPSQLIIDNGIVFEYNDIFNLFKSLAIYRIKLQHLITSDKINFIDTLHTVNYVKSNNFKQNFEYKSLRVENSTLARCLMIWLDLNESLKLFDKLICDLKFIKTNSKNNENSNIFKNYIHISDIKYLFINKFEKYQCLVAPIINVFLDDYANYTCNTFDNSNKINSFIDKYSHTKILLEKLLETIVNDNDPCINCDYHVQVSDKLNSKMLAIKISKCTGTNANIHTISHTVYCDNQINIYTNNTQFSNDFYENISYNEYYDLFSNKISLAPIHFLNIYHMAKCVVYLHLYMVDDLPYGKFDIKIINAPSKIKYISSLISNTTDTNTYNIFLNKNSRQAWLNTCSYDYQALSDSEYCALSDDFKSHYSKADTSTNVFAIDYLFNKLLHANNTNIINPKMRESFLDLAYQTSII